MANNTFQYLQEWYCPVEGKKQIVDIREPYCGFCHKNHVMGRYVAGADINYYRTNNFWYLPRFFEEDRK